MTTFRVNKCICTVGKKYKYIQYAKPVKHSLFWSKDVLTTYIQLKKCSLTANNDSLKCILRPHLGYHYFNTMFSKNV